MADLVFLLILAITLIAQGLEIIDLADLFS